MEGFIESDDVIARLAPGLLASRQWTREAHERLHRALEACADELAALACVAASGSLGRGEAGPHSDVDCVLVAARGVSSAAAVHAGEAVIDAVAQAGLRPPKRGGFFRQAVNEDQLLDPACRGSLDESPNVYGKRLQLLLDSRPLVGHERFRRLRGELLAWFACAQPADTPFALLASELVRYRRSYWAYQYHALDDAAQGGGSSSDSWGLRMAKLRSSRMITVAGLLALVGAGSVQDDPVAWVAARLDATPLARLLAVVEQWGGEGVASTLGQHYTRAQMAIETPESRQVLLTRRVYDLPAATGEAPPLVDDLDATLTALSETVNGFFLARQRDWAPWFFASLLM